MKNAHFKWEQSHQTALNKIKEELCKSQAISYYDPNPSTTTILQCDASQEGLVVFAFLISI
jgi:homogentisate 1,2-dioxygenase